MVSYHIEIWTDYDKLNIETNIIGEYNVNVFANDVVELNNKLKNIFEQIKSDTKSGNEILNFVKYVLDYHNNKFAEYYLEFDYYYLNNTFETMIYPVPANALVFDNDVKIKYYNMNKLIDFLKKFDIKIEHYGKFEWKKLIYIMDYYSKVNDDKTKLHENLQKLEKYIKDIYELHI